MKVSHNDKILGHNSKVLRHNDVTSDYNLERLSHN